MNPVFAEFLGTTLLIFIGGGVNAGLNLAKSYAKEAGWIVIALGWGLAVAFAIYAVGDISGAHINPAVTLGLASVGELDWNMVPGYILAQLLGGVCGGALVWLHYLPHWKKTEDKATKLGVFSTSPAIDSRWANVFSELSGTFVLLFVLSYLGPSEFSAGLNPLVVGALIVTIGMSHGGTTGYAINPARDLGPRIAHFILPIYGKGNSNWSYSWVPVVGPLIGGVLGATVYDAVFNGQMSFGFYISGLITVVIVILAIKEQK